MTSSRLDSLIRGLAAATSWLGGVALVAIMVLTCVSVIGRATGMGQINGDFEAVEILAGVAVFSFLPLCHLERGHATVDLLAPLFSPAFDRLLGAFADLLMLGFAVLLAWRLWFGMVDKLTFQETTQSLQFPVWISYAFGTVASVVLGIVAVHCLLRRLWPAGGGR